MRLGLEYCSTKPFNGVYLRLPDSLCLLVLSMGKARLETCLDEEKDVDERCPSSTRAVDYIRQAAKQAVSSGSQERVVLTANGSWSVTGDWMSQASKSFPWTKQRAPWLDHARYARRLKRLRRRGRLSAKISSNDITATRGLPNTWDPRHG